jgi:ADP-heptose:LPS heptosyltransferase
LTARNLKRRLKHWLGLLWWLLILQFVDQIVSVWVKRRKCAANILIVRLDGIGDFVLFLDAARKLRDKFPPGQYRITLLGNQLWTQLARRQSCFDEVWDLDPIRFVFNLHYRYKILKRVRREGFSILLNPTFARDLLWADAVVHCCGSEQRIGFFGDLSKSTRIARSVSSRWYTRLITGVEPARNEIEKSHILVKALATDVPELEMPRLDLPESAPKGLPPCFYIICPGAGDSLRRWAPENFAEIGRKIFLATGWEGVVCGSGSDSSLARKLIISAGVPLRNYCGELSLECLASTIAASKLLLANDSGAVHIAAAVGTPSVSIVGGGHLGRFLPYALHTKERIPTLVVTEPVDCAGCDWYCKFRVAKNHPAFCISLISVAAVWERVQVLLAQSLNANTALSSLTEPRQS